MPAAQVYTWPKEFMNIRPIDGRLFYARRARLNVGNFQAE